MKRKQHFFNYLLWGMVLLFSVSFSYGQAPTGFTTQAYGADELVLKWTLDGTVDSYQVEQSLDSATFTILGETQYNTYDVKGLDMNTTYYFRLTAIIGGNPVGEAGLKTGTITKDLVTHLPLNELVEGDKIKNVLTDSLDVLSNGQVTIVDSATSGIGVPVAKFLGDGPVPVASWFRLWNTVQGWDQSLTGRTMSLWFKNESPDKSAVLISFGKRAGGTIVIKDNMIFGFTGMRHGDVNKWWADSTGVAFNSTEWTNVTYVFDNPITKLYINGVKVDESDGIGKMDGFAGDTALYWPSPWEINQTHLTDGKSAELGCLFDPCAAMVAYLGDTWNNGAHNSYSFNGMMSDVKLFNYAMTDKEITQMIAAAPANIALQAVGHSDLVFAWDEGDADAYQVEMSTDSASWTIVDTVEFRSAVLTDLSPATKYFVRISSMKNGVVGSEAVASGMTTVKRLVVDMPLATLMGGDTIVNVITNAFDVKSNGQMTLVEAENTGLGVSAVNILGDGPVPVATYARLFNSTNGIDSSFTGRTISLWYRNASPDKDAVLISFGKREGMTLALKDGMIHGFTKSRFKSGGPWWADSTGAAVNDEKWTHVAYVFDFPLTKIYVNGILADVSDGIGFYDATKRDTAMFWPTSMEMASGGDKSAEIGCLMDPCAGMVQYLGDSWGAGLHTNYSFNGMIAQVKMYNYALSDDDLMAQYEEFVVVVSNFTASENGYDQIDLSWSNVAGNTGYSLSISEDNSAWTEIATLGADVVSYIVTGLTAETEYFFKIIPLGVSELVSNNTASATTGEFVNIFNLANSTIKMYPNPAANTLNIEGAENMQISIIDLSGKPLVTVTMTGSESINVSELPTGMYIVKIANGDEAIFNRISIVK